MEKVKGYFLAAYRGIQGDDATEDEISANIERALEVGYAIKQSFPDVLDLYIPHLNQEIAFGLWQDGLVTSDDIVRQCCKIIKARQLAIVYEPVF